MVVLKLTTSRGSSGRRRQCHKASKEPETTTPASEASEARTSTETQDSNTTSGELAHRYLHLAPNQKSGGPWLMARVTSAPGQENDDTVTVFLIHNESFRPHLFKMATALQSSGAQISDTANSLPPSHATKIISKALSSQVYGPGTTIWEPENPNHGFTEDVNGTLRVNEHNPCIFCQLTGEPCTLLNDSRRPCMECGIHGAICHRPARAQGEHNYVPDPADKPKVGETAFPPDI
ncbi:hypothetical protein GGR57DRAFT_506454 [Xylariaceae sp. FL1272]|nr:hypothetical protein GGR57DRAFT_506454 [Xylariaceae sp. FL1272]